jgi:broad specificity phosphatase PhoE
MTDRVWLVRHASTEWTGRRWCGRTDVPLSPQGLAEAVALAARLRALIPTSARILSSPLRRATETAAAIAAARSDLDARAAGQQSIEVEASLIEVDFGSIDGRSWAEVERELPELARTILAGRQVDWPDGESVERLARRIASIRALLDTRSSPVVLVSHAAVLGALAGALTRSPILGRIALPPAAVLELRRQGRTWQPVTGRT